MAARKTHRYLRAAEKLEPPSPDDQFELDEAEVWSTEDIITLPQTEKRVPLRKPSKNCVDADRLPIGPRSLPLNIPDWSMIVGGEFRRCVGEFEDEREEEDDGNDRIPPHEYLARTRVASFSVHEGVGRTLKGRDLSRVRNAIWKQIGFED